MQMRRAAALMVLAVVAAGCGSEGSTVTLDTDDQKASYAIGLDVGNSLKPASDHIDQDALMKGIRDAFAEAELALTAEEIQTVLQQFSETIAAEQTSQRDEIAQRNQVEGAAYLAENGAREGVVTTASGLQYEVMRDGDGPKPETGQQVTLHYRGTLTDGTQFDSSYDRGEPMTLGVGQFISGFNEGLELMSVGSQYRFVIPGNIAYGANGQGPLIGPNATLVFEVELIGIPQ